MKQHSTNWRTYSSRSFAFTFAVLVAAILVPLLSGSATANSGDAANGKKLFEKRCTGCHSLDLNKEGPQLRSVYGRAAGSVSGFLYSDALKSARHTWDDALLERWLTDTNSLVPGNDMDFRVPKAEERADIIAYLRSLAVK